MFGWLYGPTTTSEHEYLDFIPDEHRPVDVIVDETSVKVDVNIMAEVSGLFLQLKSTSAESCPLDNFPGGLETFEHIRRFFASRVFDSDAEGRPNPYQFHVNERNLRNLFEAAWLLECPKLIEELLSSAYVTGLSSRHAADVLEHVLPFTSIYGYRGRTCQPDGPPMTIEEEMAILETKMIDITEKAAVVLASRLDLSDLVLGPRLSTGSLNISCELLRLQRERQEEMGFVSSSFESVSSVWKNWTDKPLRATIIWDPHLYALQSMRKCLLPFDGNIHGQDPLPKAIEEEAEDEKAHQDISPSLCEAAPDATLHCFADLVDFVDVNRAPTNWQALLVRTLIVIGRIDDARATFASTFPTSQATVRLACKPVEPGGKPLVPVAWLGDVASHSEVACVLLKLLSGYQNADFGETCGIVDGVLLNNFMEHPENANIVLASSLVYDIVGACLAAGCKANLLAGRKRVFLANHGTQMLAGEERENEDGMVGSARAVVNGREPDCEPVPDVQNGPANAASSGVVDENANVQNLNCEERDPTSPAGSESGSWNTSDIPMVDDLGPFSQLDALSSRCPSKWVSLRDLRRFRALGVRLFEASFVHQCGYVPHTWPRNLVTQVARSRSNSDEDADSDPIQSEQSVLDASDDQDKYLEAEEIPPCRPEPTIVSMSGQCLWEEGLLKIDMLEPILRKAGGSKQDPTLHAGRVAIMRHLWCSLGNNGEYLHAPRLTRIWNMARWPLCADGRLVREALEYLKGAVRQSRACGGDWQSNHEQEFFDMFRALDFSVLPRSALLSPWVPSQLSAVHLLVAKKPLPQILADSSQNAAQTAGNIRQMQEECALLENKLNIVEQRTLVNKCQINDSITAIRNHMRPSDALPSAETGRQSVD